MAVFNFGHHTSLLDMAFRRLVADFIHDRPSDHRCKRAAARTGVAESGTNIFNKGL
jgi:hypothetical protein